MTTSSPKFVGQRKNLALFESRGKAVFINTKTLTASISSIEEARTSHDARGWDTSSNPDPIWVELASAAIQRELGAGKTTLAQGKKRTYTVPKKVAEAAHSVASVSLSPISKYVASMLSSGQQISCEDVLWVSRFFDSNSVGSTNRVVYNAWGGVEGQRWSQSLAERLDYDSVIADGGQYDTPGVAAFLMDSEDQISFWTELSEERSQNTDNLYMLTPQGTWQAWGNGDWIQCESSPELSNRFIELDSEAALYVAGALFDAPESPVDLRTPNPEAWDLAEAAYNEIDWTIVDRSMRASGNVLSPEYLNSVKNNYSGTSIDSDFAGTANPVTADYSPEERAANASGQLRDANGRFADVGASGAIKSSGLGGTITESDPSTGHIKVQASDGQIYDIPANDFEVGAQAHPKSDPQVIKDDPTVDFVGIVAPEVEPVMPKAILSADAHLLGPAELSDALDSYSERITEERQEKAKDFKKLLEDPADSEESIQAAAEVPSEDVATDVASDVPPPSADPTPDKTDVEPIYMAIVERDDPRAVMDLVALVPATATSSEAKTYRRSAGKWVEDPKILADIRSATPPPVVQLDAEQLKDVLQQIDFEGVETPEDAPVTAAGGLDRNRGNAEKLREYWTVGPGGLKIRWNTGGDWTRCVRLLSKHLGPRAKGYCALRHREMTGMWPGDRNNREMSADGLIASGTATSSQTYLTTLPAVIRASADFAAAEVARARVYGTFEFEPVVPSAEDITEGRSGQAFRIPVLIPEGIATGDGRMFGKGAIGMRTLPLPLMWQPATGDGHDTSYIVGRIDRIERIEGGLGNAYGVFDTGPYGKEAQRLVQDKMLRWVSADLDKFEVDEDRSDEETGKMYIKKGRVMGATLVAKPAFQECTIELVVPKENEMPETQPSAISASAAIAASIPVEPPAAWFEAPKFSGVTPISVSDEGRIYGHLASWDSTHIGMAGGIRPPRSSSNYAYFNKGILRTAEGKDVRVGQFTLVGGHAPIHLSATDAVKHYDDTHSAYADVHVGEDSYGIWFSGALRPGVTPEQIRAIRASALSGDWRAINRRLELVATCSVNVPGFQMQRSMVASAKQSDYALVAAGMVYAGQDESEALEALTAAARDRIERLLGVDEFMSKANEAGKFIIESAAEVRKAMFAYDKISSAKSASARRQIVRAARAYNCTDLIPSSWKELSLDESALSYRDRYEELLSISRAAKVAELSARVAAIRSNTLEGK